MRSLASKTSNLYASVGCYKDKRSRDLKKHMRGTKHTMESCGKTCAGKKYKYFSLQYRGECFCGNSYGKYKKASNCNMKCKKDKSQTCGGKWANSVFRVRRFAYLGCFKDKSSRDIKSQQSGGNGSRAKCGATCAKKGMKYFGLHYGKYKKASNCNMKCGNGKETCGGTWANSVYQVMKKSRRLMSAPMRSLASKTSNLYASVGCYKDKRSRDLKKHWRGNHTMESCG